MLYSILVAVITPFMHEITVYRYCRFRPKLRDDFHMFVLIFL